MKRWVNDETDCASNGTQRRRKRQFGPKRRRGIRYANYERTLEEEDIKQTEEYKYAETMGNENSNGNALYLIIMQWAEQRK